MDVGTLIDAIVRQTTVLIAQLATSGGERTPLTHTANQVFLDLARELREQGLGSKVVADMFGMALRTYQTKVQRLSESRTERGRTLWEALYEHIREHGGERPIARAELLRRFRHDDPIAVRSVLRDQVDSGLVSRTGTGDATRYQLVVQARGEEDSEQRLEQVVAMMVHRLAPVTAARLAETLSCAVEQVQECLSRLQADGRVRAQSSIDAQPTYSSQGCILPLGSELGWEVAVFDHYQAMVSALCAKLQSGPRRATHADWIGGSTFSFRVWPEHPYYEEATGFLASFRARGSALRKKIAEYNSNHSVPEAETARVLIYAGQNVIVESNAYEQEQEQEHE